MFLFDTFYELTKSVYNEKTELSLIGQLYNWNYKYYTLSYSKKQSHLNYTITCAAPQRYMSKQKKTDFNEIACTYLTKMFDY